MKRRNAYSNPRLWVAQRCTEFAVSESTTNATSVCPAEGLPTCIAQMPGTLATNGFAPADDASCGRVYAGRPAVAGDATLLKVYLSYDPWSYEWVGISLGQGGHLSFGDIGGYGR